MALQQHQHKLAHQESLESLHQKTMITDSLDGTDRRPAQDSLTNRSYIKPDAAPQTRFVPQQQRAQLVKQLAKYIRVNE